MCRDGVSNVSWSRDTYSELSAMYCCHNYMLGRFLMLLHRLGMQYGDVYISFKCDLRNDTP